MRINERKYRTIWYDEKEDGVFIIDQTKLPFEVSIVRLNTLDDVLNS